MILPAFLLSLDLLNATSRLIVEDVSVGSAGPYPFLIDTGSTLEHQEAVYPGQPGYYLLHLCADGQGTDTWHESLEDAIYQAGLEFGVRQEEWTRTEPY